LQKEGEEVDYRNVLHRDGSVLMSVSLDQLKVNCTFLLFFLELSAICIATPKEISAVINLIYNPFEVTMQ
jgi:hypothetical protein